MKGQRGLGLIEVLISLFLASIIMTVLGQLYLNNKRQYIHAQNALQEHFDVRWVSELLSNSIRRAGFTPCLGVDRLITIDRRNFKEGISALQINALPRQSIQINRMSEVFAQVLHVQNANELIVSNQTLFNPKRPLIIADCEHAEIHRILKIERFSKNLLVTLTKPLMFSYTAPIFIGEWLEEQWFIKSNIKGEKSLHYQLFQPEELTPLVHSLMIKEQRIDEKRVLEVVLGLDREKTHKLIVAVRGS